MPKWEYLVVDSYYFDVTDKQYKGMLDPNVDWPTEIRERGKNMMLYYLPSGWRPLANALNKLGNDGWELAGMTQVMVTALPSYFFKRPKQ